MPSTSKKQHNFMEAVAHNKKFAKKVGVPMSVGKDFSEADKGRKFGTGGSTGVTYGGQGQINKQRTRFGSKFGYKLNAPNESLNKFVGKAEGGEVKSFRKGGSTNPSVQGINKQKTNHGSTQMPNAMLNKHIGRKDGGIMKTVDTAKNPGLAKLPTEVRNKMGYAKNGGMMKHSDMAKDKPMMKKIADVEAKKIVKGHESRMHKMASGGKASQLSKANGCVVKGKSKGTMVKMNKGGSC